VLNVFAFQLSTARQFVDRAVPRLVGRAKGEVNQRLWERLSFIER
jgi:Arc/MetJ family transcription regulator